MALDKLKMSKIVDAKNEYPLAFRSRHNIAATKPSELHARPSGHHGGRRQWAHRSAARRVDISKTRE
ncbi:MAG: hypothetical protein RLN94_19245 [Roseovarius sp.]|uniref:hypothetical protein n=1 Tax=Roseovarius sp. TaxID=1486281 RepID=UPI0032EBD548